MIAAIYDVSETGPGPPEKTREKEEVKNRGALIWPK